MHSTCLEKTASPDLKSKRSPRSKKQASVSTSPCIFAPPATVVAVVHTGSGEAVAHPDRVEELVGDNVEFDLQLQTSIVAAASLLTGLETTTVEAGSTDLVASSTGPPPGFKAIELVAMMPLVCPRGLAASASDKINVVRSHYVTYQSTNVRVESKKTRVVTVCMFCGDRTVRITDHVRMCHGSLSKEDRALLSEASNKLRVANTVKRSAILEAVQSAVSKRERIESVVEDVLASLNINIIADVHFPSIATAIAAPQPGHLEASATASIAPVTEPTPIIRKLVAPVATAPLPGPVLTRPVKTDTSSFPGSPHSSGSDRVSYVEGSSTTQGGARSLYSILSNIRVTSDGESDVDLDEALGKGISRQKQVKVMRKRLVLDKKFEYLELDSHTNCLTRYYFFLTQDLKETSKESVHAVNKVSQIHYYVQSKANAQLYAPDTHALGANFPLCKQYWTDLSSMCDNEGIKNELEYLSDYLRWYMGEYKTPVKNATVDAQIKIALYWMSGLKRVASKCVSLERQSRHIRRCRQGISKGE